MTEQNSKKKELNKMEIKNLADAKFKTLVIRMLKEIIECRQQHKRRNEVYPK